MRGVCKEGTLGNGFLDGCFFFFLVPGAPSVPPEWDEHEVEDYAHQEKYAFCSDAEHIGDKLHKTSQADAYVAYDNESKAL